MLVWFVNSYDANEEISWDAAGAAFLPYYKRKQKRMSLEAFLVENMYLRTGLSHQTLVNDLANVEAFAYEGTIRLRSNCAKINYQVYHMN